MTEVDVRSVIGEWVIASRHAGHVTGSTARLCRNAARGPRRGSTPASTEKNVQPEGGKEQTKRMGELWPRQSH